jgi:diguanylate cyclase (GGDEF)-like protein/PAS domain S-box-containing protein
MATRRKRAPAIKRNKPSSRKAAARPLLTSLSSDWYWEQDASLRFVRVQVQAGTPGEEDLAAKNLGRRPWETGICVEGGWEAHRALLKRRAPFREVLMWRDFEDGSRRYISISGEPLFDARGRFAGYRGVGRDVTQQKRGELLLRLQHTVTRRLAEAAGPAEGVQGALQAICETEGWDCGELWRSDAAGEVMRRFASWAMPGVAPAERFIEMSGSHEFRPGEGLIGSVWQSGAPLWIADAARDERAVRKFLTDQTGLRGALLCPVPSGGRTVGVLAFACCRIRPPDERLLQALAALGTQLGLYLRRMDSEARLRESEERFRRTFELAGSGVAHLDLERRFLRVNRKLCEILGYPERELIGRPVTEVSYPDDLEMTSAERERLYRGEIDSLRMEKRYLRKDGSVVWAALTLALERDAQGEPLYEIAVYDDVTARKAAEDLMRESEERFRRTFELAGSGVAHVGVDGRFLRVNRRLCEMFGHAEDELVGRSVKELSHPEDRDVTDTERARMHRGEIGVARFQKRYLRKDASTLWAEMSVTLERDAAGTPLYEISVLDDISARKAAEAALRDSEARYRHTFELAGVGVAHIGLDRRFQRVNRRFCEILGFAEEELIGRTGREFSHPEDLDHMNQQRPRLYAGEIEAVRGEKRYLRKDGSVVWVAYTLALERDAAGNPQHEIAVYDDVSGRKSAETALRDSEARFRSLTELSSDWFWEQDADYRFTRVEGRYAGGGAASLREQVLGKCCWERDLKVEGGWDAYRALLEARLPFQDVLMSRRLPDGRMRYVSISGEPVFDAEGRFAGYRGVGSDVSERKRAEQLLQLEHQVARALSEADDVAGGLRAVMRAVCRSEGWARGRYFTLDGTSDSMVFEHEWPAGDPAGGGDELSCRRGEGPVGRAWQEGGLAWSGDHCAFPVRSEGLVIGVLAFSTREPREPDGRLREATDVIGAEVGQFLRRMRAEENMRRFRLGMDSSADMILLIDVTTMRFIDVNSTACSLLGYSREELLAMGPQDVLPLSREELARSYEALIASPTTLGAMHSHFLCKDGSRLPFESTRRVLQSAGRPIVVAISRDIRERIAAEEALRESEARFRALTEMSSDFYWETDARHVLTDMTYGRGAVGSPDDALGRAAWDIPSTHPDEAGWAAMRRKVDGHQPFRDFEFGRPRRDGGVRYFSVSGEPRFATDGRFLGYRGVGRDITEVVLARERIASLAYHDALTGLANRTSLAPALEQAVERTRRRGNHLAGVFLDLDGFKQINDLHGHDAGDRLLVEAAQRLRAALRSSDPVARLGGDEFFVVLEDLQNNAPAERVANKLLAALLEPYDLGEGRQARISASIGISVFPDDAGDAATLMKHADAAMYAAKQAGKNAYRFFIAGAAANDVRAPGEESIG